MIGINILIGTIQLIPCTYASRDDIIFSIILKALHGVGELILSEKTEMKIPVYFSH